MPFRDIFVDHFGPYQVKRGKETVKVWILCFSCLWSRAINLEVAYDLTASEFLRNFQIQVLKNGVPQHIFSDLGSSIVAGGNILKEFCKDVATQLYFRENGLSPIKFEHFFKGRKELGSLVEICVKLCKKLISAAIGKNILVSTQFELVIAQTVSIVNKRPIAFKQSLTTEDTEYLEDIDPITPEILLRGYDLPVLNVLPDESLVSDFESPQNLGDTVVTNFERLNKVRKRLVELYNEQFLSQLLDQSIDQKNRYQTVKHEKLKPGDIVLLKEDNTKRINYPLAIVREVFENPLEEVTSVVAKKGKNRELVKRHVSSVIPILTTDSEIEDKTIVQGERTGSPPKSRKLRKSAEASGRKSKDMIEEGLV